MNVSTPLSPVATTAPALSTVAQVTTGSDSIDVVSTFLTVFGGSAYDDGYSVKETKDGGFLLSGRTTGAESVRNQILLTKLNKKGVISWIKVMEGIISMYGSLELTEDGGCLLTGSTYSTSHYADVLLMKLNVNGGIAWAKTLAETSDRISAQSATQIEGGGFVLTGRHHPSESYYSQALVVKLDEMGGVAWARSLGGGYSDEGYSIQGTKDGGVVLTGKTQKRSTTSAGAGSYNVLVAKFDKDGSLSWSKALGASRAQSSGYGYSIKETKDEGFVLTGSIYNYLAIYQGHYDVLVAKLDKNGTLAWAKSFGGARDEYGYSIEETTDGGVVLTGSIISFATHILVVKLDKTGDLSWAKTLGEAAYEYGYSIQQTKDGGFVLAGATTRYGSNDVLVAKLDKHGEIENCTEIQDVDLEVTDLSSDLVVTYAGSASNLLLTDSPISIDQEVDLTLSEFETICYADLMPSTLEETTISSLETTAPEETTGLGKTSSSLRTPTNAVETTTTSLNSTGAIESDQRVASELDLTLIIGVLIGAVSLIAIAALAYFLVKKNVCKKRETKGNAAITPTVRPNLFVPARTDESAAGSNNGLDNTMPASGFDREADNHPQPVLVAAAVPQ